MTEEEEASEGRGREASLYIRPPYTRQFDKFFCRKKGKRKGKGGAGEPPPLIKEDKFAAKRSFLPLFFPSPEGKRKEGHSTKFTKSPGGNRERASPSFFPCLWVFYSPSVPVPLPCLFRSFSQGDECGAARSGIGGLGRRALNAPRFCTLLGRPSSSAVVKVGAEAEANSHGE